MKKFTIVFTVLFLTSCAEMQQVINQLPGTTVTDADIAAGLRQALDLGIQRQVSKLIAEDGFYKNELVKILLPEELQKVDKGLRSVGLGNLADQGLLLMNRAAESAVKEATPIFVNAVKEMTFTDARNILLGSDNAATNYLIDKTQTALYQKFQPIIQSSFARVGADQVWSNIISRYNDIPLTTDVNPNLTDYVTTQALEGVYTMISLEEKAIRNNAAARTTAVLQRVFSLQDQR
ncbi:MAG: DUF4197 domain-containing protein [Flavobacteriaceae bacterium]|nr:DUF4197 domain-containing protein [Flavobacteriaceae bacterium]